MLLARQVVANEDGLGCWPPGIPHPLEIFLIISGFADGSADQIRPAATSAGNLAARFKTNASKACEKIGNSLQGGPDSD